MRKKTMPELHRLTTEQARTATKLPVVVVLDDVRSEMNVGSIFRTADAMGVAHIYLCGITACPPRPEIHKTALGAEDSVPWSHHSSIHEVIAQLRGEGYTICSVEQVHGSISLEQYEPSSEGRYALILGNEVRGVAQEAVDESDCCLELPQRGAKHSLNVACTAAIVMWHFMTHLS